MEPTNENEACKVKELIWDPFSSDYILVLTQKSIIRLIDVNIPSVLVVFNWMGNKHLSCMTWVTTAPGMFITTEANSSKLTIWNVCQTTPVITLPTKLKTLADFHSILFIKDSNEHEKNESSSFLDSSRQKHRRFKNSEPCVELPPGAILSTFSDGGVGLFNMRMKKWDFYKEMGHIETVFDCKFHPDDPNILASAGFDGNLKIWDLTVMSSINSMKFIGIIYSISWSPDGARIAVATEKNDVHIWDLNNNSLQHTFSEHTSKVYTVSWNLNGSKLASCSEDGNLIMRDLSSSKVVFHKHSCGVYGCDWAPSETNTIATGCGDGRVRLIKESLSHESIAVLSGHDARVFQVKWCQIHKWILLSGSDDCSIKVWDTEKEECMQTLVGHQKPVRGLLWIPEVPHLVLSGSWDSHVLVWDLRKGQFIDSIRHHGADVYGLTCHPKRPFLIASTSRDSTIRFTDISKFILPQYVKLILGHQFQDICLHSVPIPRFVSAAVVGSSSATAAGSSSGLCGNYSNILSKLLQTTTSTGEILRKISTFFGSGFGHENLWTLIDAHLGKDLSLLPATYKNGIVHHKHLLSFKMSETAELEVSSGGLMVSNPEIHFGGRFDRLVCAMGLEVNLGNMEKCCEILIMLDEWDKALAIAPSVSMEYWKSMMGRRCDCLKKEDVIDESSLPYFASLGRSDDLIEYYTSLGKFNDALVVAASNWDKTVTKPELKTRSKDHGDQNFDENNSADLKVRKIMNKMADKFFLSGSPVVAACCHMAIDDVESAMSKLIRGGEWELAVSVGCYLGNVQEHLSEAAKCLARKCEKESLSHMAIEVVEKYVLNGKQMLLGQICCRAVDDEMRGELLAKAGFLTPLKCREKAEDLEKNLKENYCEVVFYYLLSDDWMTGLEIGTDKIKEIMSNPNFNPSEVQDLIQIMSSLHKDKLAKCLEHKHKLMAISAYIGALLAIRRDYDVIVPYLFQCALSILSKHDLDIGISKDVISNEFETWISNLKSSSNKINDNLRKVDQLNDSYDIIERGCVVVVGSLMPSHSITSSVSLFTKQAIQGENYFLEDGCWSISINDALMWSMVNNFSPFCSGEQINPF